MTTPTLETSPLDEAYRDRVLARFDARRASFVKQFTLLAVFTISFGAFMLAPMVALKIESDDLDVELSAQNEALRKLEERKTSVAAKREALQAESDLLNGRLTSLVFALETSKEEAHARRERLDELRAELAQIVRGREESQRRIEALQVVATRSSEALDRFDARRRTDAFRAWFARMAAGDEPDSPCPATDRSEYFRCMVRERLRADWDRDFESLESAVVEPLRTVDGDAADAIHANLVEVRGRFVANLEGNQDFWRTIDEKLGFMTLLEQEMERAFQGIRLLLEASIAGVRERLEGLEVDLAASSSEERALAETLDSDQSALQAIEAELEAGFAEADDLANERSATDERLQAMESTLATRRATFERERDAVETRRQAIENTQADIAKRFDQFQSPFGTLPLGLKEATLAFPFLVAVGFAVCAFLLGDLLRLRREYHRLLSSEYPSVEAVSDRVRVGAPLWLDPVAPAWQSSAVMLLLLCPVAVFVLAAAMVSSGWLLPLEPAGSDGHLMAFYNGMYALGGLAIVITVAIVALAWARYGEQLDSLRTGSSPRAGTPAQGLERAGDGASGTPGVPLPTVSGGRAPLER